jgi:hypothetical protein
MINVRSPPANELSSRKFINAIDLDRKSGGAQWRDLRFPFFDADLLPVISEVPADSPKASSTGTEIIQCSVEIF